MAAKGVEAAWEELVEATAGFHDGVVAHAELAGGSHVRPDYSMVNPDAPLSEARLRLQFQWKDCPAVSVAFGTVFALRFDNMKDYGPSIERVSDLHVDEMWRFRFLAVEVVASTLEWIRLDASHLGPAVPGT